MTGSFYQSEAEKLKEGGVKHVFYPAMGTSVEL
jgi:hypothetical protein